VKIACAGFYTFYSYKTIKMKQKMNKFVDKLLFTRYNFNYQYQFHFSVGDCVRINDRKVNRKIGGFTILKESKKMIASVFAVLMLFGGLMVSTPLQVDAAVSRCQTGGPVNQATYRVNARTYFRRQNANGTLGNQMTGWPIAAGDHVTRASGGPANIIAGGHNYRQVRHPVQSGHYMGKSSTLNSCCYLLVLGVNEK